MAAQRLRGAKILTALATHGGAMSDADDRFVETLAVKLAPLVGPRLRVSAIDLYRPAEDHVRVVVTLETSAKPRTMIEEGDSLTEVTARLLASAPEVRLGEAMREIIDGVEV